jgi:indole-3-glycerol phosphate synthase
VDILEHIVETKKHEVKRAQKRLPLETLQSLTQPCTQPYAWGQKLQNLGQAPHVIAEIKRASPSKGVLQPSLKPYQWDAEHLCRQYAEGGAAVLSVLTDVRFFWGNPDVLQACAQASGLPVLRKDFVVDPYQVDESRWLGADAVLLIARVLDEEVLHACAQRAHVLGMSVLVEVHQQEELSKALSVPHALIGVNNRDLATMTLDPMRAARMRALIPEHRVVVAESGLTEHAQLQALMQEGVHVFLVGEHLAAHPHPAQALKALRGV